MHKINSKSNHSATSHDRFILLGIIFAVWAFIKLLESILPDRLLEFLPGPFPMAVLFVMAMAMMTYMVIIYFAQKWKERSRVSKLEAINLNHFDKAYPSIDIFVAAHNEQSVILDTLQNLLQIDYPNFTIYVIDDRSMDQTADLVDGFISKNKLHDKVMLIRRVNGQTPGKAASLNQAITQSSGQLILVVDADARLETDCLKRSLHYFQDPKVGAIQFQKRIRNAPYNTLTLCQDLEFAFDTYLQLGRDSINGFVELRGSGQITSRDCLQSVGGWNEVALTEDLDISVRIAGEGWKIRFAPEIIISEEGVITTTALFKQRRRWAEGSLRRYLSNFGLLISPYSKISLAQRLDILPFVCQFAIPVWVFLDVLVICLHLAQGKPTHIPILILATVLVSLNMWINIAISIRRWRDYSPLESIKYATLAFAYGTAHWPPLVLWTMRKVILGRRPTEWSKTPRMRDILNPQSESNSLG